MTKHQHNTLTRRRFLALSAWVSGGLLLPGVWPQTPTSAAARPAGGLASRYTNAPGPLTPLYLEWFEQPYLAPLNTYFDQEIGDQTIAFMLYNLTEGRLIAALRPEQALPVASTFKAAVLLHFFDVVSPDIWASVPLEYWTVRDRNAVPDAYLDAWRNNLPVYRDLWNMIVLSDNPATGRMMLYNARVQGREDPIAALNDWLHERVGISQLSGISNWAMGVPPGIENTDMRFFGREANIDHNPYPYANLMTVRDVGLIFTWYQDNFTPQQRDYADGLLSTINQERRANIERLAFANEGIAYSKNGTVGAGDSTAGTVITDAGSIDLPDGTRYLLAMLSVNAEVMVPRIFELSQEVIRGQHDDAIAAVDDTIIELQAANSAYRDYLAIYYPEVAQLSTEQFNYGFVSNAAIPVHSAPDEANRVRNPVISASRFGVHLLMQGALIRFLPVDTEWLELVPDAHNDNVRTRLADRVFIKRADVHPIDSALINTIDYFLEPGTQPNEKMVVIEIQERWLSILERGRVIFRTPIALSNFATPRGSYPITSKWLSRSMQAWAPGVPFTVFFHIDGYAIHGAPWQRWMESVTEENFRTRISAGCINLPNWGVTLGEHTRPLDELFFRWVGSVEDPGHEVYEHPRSGYHAMRIFSVDWLQDLSGYALPAEISRYDVRWADIIEAIQNTRPLAPPSFFA